MAGFLEFKVTRYSNLSLVSTVFFVFCFCFFLISTLKTYLLAILVEAIWSESIPSFLKLRGWAGDGGSKLRALNYLEPIIQTLRYPQCCCSQRVTFLRDVHPLRLSHQLPKGKRGGKGKGKCLFLYSGHGFIHILYITFNYRHLKVSTSEIEHLFF